MPRMQIPKKLQGLITEQVRHKVPIGGRGSAKSRTVAQSALMDCQVKDIKTACFREYMNTIDDSMHSLLCSEIKRMGLQGFKTLDREIKYQGRDAFKYRGMARNVEGIQSMDGFGKAIVEEAQTTSSKSLRTLIPTFRDPGSEIWWPGNPRSAADPFSQRFIVPFQKQLRRDGYYKDDHHLVVMCNWRDNPWFPPELEAERQYDKEHLSDALYRHIWEGEFYDEVENCIIPVEWFDAAIDAHIKLGFKPEGARVVSHDPSDEGDDDKGLSYRQGVVILDARSRETGDINDGCEWALDYAQSVNADHFVWDADGMGVALKRDIAAALGPRKTTYEPFHGQGQVDDPDREYKQPDQPDDLSQRRRRTNRETFKNKRAQYWWDLRDRFYRTYAAIEKKQYIDPDLLISLSSDIEEIDQLRAEICRIPRKHNVAGKIQIMSKQEMAALPEPIPSPNMGDSCMMLMCKPPTVAQTVQLRSSSPWGR